MAFTLKDGKPVKMTEEEERSFNERFNRGRNAGAQPVARSGGGGKGGRPDINPNTNEGAEALAMAQAQFNNDGSFGYYNDWHFCNVHRWSTFWILSIWRA